MAAPPRRSSPSPPPVQGLDNVISIFVGRSHTLAMRKDRCVWAWGSNSAGQLGDGTADTRPLPVRVGGIGNQARAAGMGSGS